MQYTNEVPFNNRLAYSNMGRPIHGKGNTEFAESFSLDMSPNTHFQGDKRFSAISHAINHN